MLIRLVRILLALALLTAGAALRPRSLQLAHANAPTISVSPAAVTPHGSIQVTGSGFDPSSGGQQVTVNIALVNSGGTFPLGSLPIDAQGNIGGNGAAPLTLPFTVDVSSANQVTATEAGNSASFPVNGTLLQPQLNGGQPLSAQLGSQLDVKGSGFAPADTLSVSLDGTPLNTGTGGTTTTADTTGAADIALVVPQTALAGTHTLTIAGSATGAGQHDQATQTLTLTAAPAGTATTTAGSLVVTPNPAAVGTTLVGKAGGFQPNEPVTFTLKYYDLGTSSYAIQNSPATADTSGNATALISIPASADGGKPASVTVTGNQSNVTYTVPLTFAVLAAITFNPPSAAPGAQVTVNGTGFVPGERLFVTTRLFTPPVGGFAVVDAAGHFSVTVTLLGTLQPGTLVLAVSGSGGDNASATFTVTTPAVPTVRINPTTAPSDSTIAANGQGFGPNETVNFGINSVRLGSTVTDALGVFTATVTLSTALAPGNYTLQAQGASAASVPISLTAPLNNRWYFAEGFTGQGPKVFFHETITVLNPSDKPANGTINYQFADGSTEALPISIKARGLLIENVNDDVGPNRIVSALVRTDRAIVAERTLTRTDAAKHALDSDFSPGANGPEADWYFAEGYSGDTFQPYLSVQNPNTVPVSLTVTLYGPHGPAKIVKATAPPLGRYTLNLRSALPRKPFSIHLAASQPVMAERVEYWGDGSGSAKFGAGVKPGVPLPMTTWYFGYAAILGGDQGFISILNANSKAAHVQAHFFDGTGKSAGSATITIGPGQRGTLKLNALLGKHPHSPIAVIVNGDLPVVAEEAQYFGGSPNVGAHPGANIEGRSSTATRWSFASGNTNGFQENEYIFNPSSRTASVNARFLGADGQVKSVSYQVKPRQVITISANAVPGLHRGAHGSVWTVVTKNVRVVVVQTLRGADGRTSLADQGIPG